MGDSYSKNERHTVQDGQGSEQQKDTEETDISEMERFRKRQKKGERERERERKRERERGKREHSKLVVLGMNNIGRTVPIQGTGSPPCVPHTSLSALSLCERGPAEALCTPLF